MRYSPKNTRNKKESVIALRLSRPVDQRQIDFVKEFRQYVEQKYTVLGSEVLKVLPRNE